MSLSCPRCAGALQPTARVDVVVCAGCGGAFLPATAHETLARALDPQNQQLAALVALRAARPIDARPGARCPRCATLMQRYRVGVVDVDTCHEHGSWYDRGELEAVRDALDAGAVGVAVEAPPPMPSTKTAPTKTAPTTNAPLELARQPSKKPRPMPPRGHSRSSTSSLGRLTLDADAQRSIDKLVASEQRDAKRHRKEHRHGHTSAAHDAIDLISDLLD